MRRILILVVTALVATLTASAAALAQATTTTESTTVFFDSVLNPDFFSCGSNAEPIAFNGKLHLLVHTTENASGGFNVVIEYNTQDMTATGVNSGEPYRFIQVGKSTTTLPGEGATEATVESTFNVISMGPPPNEPNYLTTFVSHLTINPNGEPTAEIVDANLRCQG